VNGAVYFDPRYLGNRSSIAVMWVDASRQIVQRAESRDYIVAIGGRTGRDGIHGATSVLPN